MSNADIVFALFCLLVLPFAYGQEIPPSRYCSCIGNLTCDFSKVYCAPMDSGACRRENVALGQPASMSSFHRSLNNVANAACVGVNGNTTNHWLPLDENPMRGNCIHTSPTQQGIHFWEVTLDKSYWIKYITLYSRITQAVRMIHVTVLVESRKCYTFENSPNAQAYYKIECNPPATGRRVRLEKPPFDYKYNIPQVDYCINVCEVQVWVCKQGFYGPECAQCDPCVNCDIVNGSCSGGCKAGHYGHRCLQTCPNCLNNSCNNQGICPAGCKTGYKGEKCDISCKAGESGQECCPKCVDDNCNNQWICQSGCRTGYAGEKCDIIVTAAPPPVTQAPPPVTQAPPSETTLSPPTVTQAPPASTKTNGGVGMYVGIGFLILALLAACLVFCILAARRKKKEEEEREGGEGEGGEGGGGEGGEGEENVEALQETETPAAPENEEPVDQEAVEELNPNPESETKEEGNEQADQGEEQVAEPEVVPDE